MKQRKVYKRLGYKDPTCWLTVHRTSWRFQNDFPGQPQWIAKSGRWMDFSLSWPVHQLIASLLCGPVTWKRNPERTAVSGRILLVPLSATNCMSWEPYVLAFPLWRFPGYMPTTFLSSSLFTGGGNIKTLKEEPPLRKERKRCSRVGILDDFGVNHCGLLITFLGVNTVSLWGFFFLTVGESSGLVRQ